MASHNHFFIPCLLGPAIWAVLSGQAGVHYSVLGSLGHLSPAAPGAAGSGLLRTGPVGCLSWSYVVFHLPQGGSVLRHGMLVAESQGGTQKNAKTLEAQAWYLHNIMVLEFIPDRKVKR